MVNGMQAHPQVVDVQHWGCTALIDLCCGDDAAALSRRQRVVEAGAIRAVVAAMKAHLQVVDVQVLGSGLGDTTYNNQGRSQCTMVANLKPYGGVLEFQRPTASV